MDQQASISVHERLDGPGYLVRVVVVDEAGDEIKRAKFPADTQEEASGLAASFKLAAEMGFLTAVVGE